MRKHFYQVPANFISPNIKILPGYILDGWNKTILVKMEIAQGGVRRMVISAIFKYRFDGDK